MSEFSIAKFKENLNEINKYVKEKNFETCKKLSLDLVRLSYFLDFDDGIFFSEFIDNIFDDLMTLGKDYVLEEKDAQEIIDTIMKFINTLKESLPQLKNIREIYELLRATQDLTTKAYFKYTRRYEKKTIFPSITVGED
jgi:hypothetical protein